MSADTPVRRQGCPQTGVSLDRAGCRRKGWGRYITQSSSSQGAEKVSFCLERPLSAGTFLKRLQGVHRQISRSEDLEEEQRTRFMSEVQEGQDMDVFRIPHWKRKSLACSSMHQLSCVSRDGVSCSNQKR